MKKYSILFVFLGVSFVGCRQETPLSATIAVTNSYLECAVRDLCGDIPVLCLTPPGMCPGHFDILPSTVTQLRHCRLLLRFEFQRGMDESMRRYQENGLQIQEITAPAGLCIPQNYAAVCEAVCRALCVCYPGKQELFENRLRTIRQRMADIEKTILGTLHHIGLEQVNVVCSTHQAEFAKSIGLNVVSTFLGRDMATPANMGQCLAAVEGRRISYVIANKQEGTELAQALARRLNARVAVFSNFPETGDRMAFDGMILENVHQLQAHDTK